MLILSLSRLALYCVSVKKALVTTLARDVFSLGTCNSKH